MGKKQTKTTVKIFVEIPKPNHNTNSGATAMIGMVCEITIYGYIIFLSQLTQCMAMAQSIPRTKAMPSPDTLAKRVGKRCMRMSLGCCQKTSMTLLGEGITQKPTQALALAICQRIRIAKPKSKGGRISSKLLFFTSVPLCESPSANANYNAQIW